MEIAITIIGVLLIIMSVFLVVAVLMQSSKDHRLGASIAGGAETFFGKAKGKSMDAMFNKLTTVIAVLFVVLVLVLYFIQPGATINEVTSGADITSSASMADIDNDEDEDASAASMADLGDVEEDNGVVEGADAGEVDAEADNAGADAEDNGADE